jgi:hypothetical protein
MSSKSAAISWRRIPFAERFVGLSSNPQRTYLPFAVGGGTQQGLQHQAENLNNQDAMSVVIHDDFILGLVCDGCTGTDATLYNDVSNNECGAKLTCWLVAEAFRRRFAGQFGDPDLDPQRICRELGEDYLSALEQLANCLSSGEAGQRRQLLGDFLTTTLVGFVLTPFRYVVFHSGDGLCSINGEVIGLGDSGLYISSILMGQANGSDLRSGAELLEVVGSGDVSSLQSVIIATDGMAQLLHGSGCAQQLSSAIAASSRATGLCFILPTFRKQLGQSSVALDPSWPSDDATFVIATRVDPIQCGEAVPDQSGGHDATAVE